jgi:hypothetical protein
LFCFFCFNVFFVWFHVFVLSFFMVIFCSMFDFFLCFLVQVL